MSWWGQYILVVRTNRYNELILGHGKYIFHVFCLHSALWVYICIYELSFLLIQNCVHEHKSGESNPLVLQIPLWVRLRFFLKICQMHDQGVTSYSWVDPLWFSNKKTSPKNAKKPHGYNLKVTRTQGGTLCGFRGVHTLTSLGQSFYFELLFWMTVYSRVWYAPLGMDGIYP